MCVIYIYTSYEQCSKESGDSFFQYRSEHWTSHLQQGYAEAVETGLQDTSLSLYATN